MRKAARVEICGRLPSLWTAKRGGASDTMPKVAAADGVEPMEGHGRLWRSKNVLKFSSAVENIKF